LKAKPPNSGAGIKSALIQALSSVTKSFKR